MSANQLPPPASPAPAAQTGEWQLPLGPDALSAMRRVMAANPGGLDEGLLASCYSWMRKAGEDKLEGAPAPPLSWRC